MLEQLPYHPSRGPRFAEEFALPTRSDLKLFLNTAQSQHNILPPREMIFRAFDLTPLDRVRVVLLGQDPYHDDGQAHGLSFSVTQGTQFPPSLINIYKELESDLGRVSSTQGDLTHRADQGVLLLNSILTVSAHLPTSHHNSGRQYVTDHIITKLSQHREELVFMLWGNFAKTKIPLIDTTKHLILTASHPSPLGAYKSFWGCKHFSKCNTRLIDHGHPPIDW